MPLRLPLRRCRIDYAAMLPLADADAMLRHYADIFSADATCCCFSLLLMPPCHATPIRCCCCCHTLLPLRHADYFAIRPLDAADAAARARTRTAHAMPLLPYAAARCYYADAAAMLISCLATLLRCCCCHADAIVLMMIFHSAAIATCFRRAASATPPRHC